jgi:hypothetical protein
MLNQLIAVKVYPYFTTEWWFVTGAAIATIGLYSILFRENRFYRVVEHIFLGLGAGTAIALTWSLEMRGVWWVPFYDKGYYLWVLPIPIALLGYTVFSQKHGWMSRIPIGILVGLGAGTIFKTWVNRWVPQIQSTMVPLWPNNMQFQEPPGLHQADQLYISGAINNLILVVTTIAVLTYFFFSFEQKWKLVRGTAQVGRWLLMVAFGAIFGATIMNRFVLMIDRIWFLLIEWAHVRPPM